MIFGVAGGLGEYFQIDPTMVRLVLVVLVLSGGLGLWLYLILALLLPSEIEDGGEKKKEAKSNKTINVDRRNMFGWVIILLGITAMFNELMPGFWRWDIFWPLTMIIAGTYLVLK